MAAIDPVATFRQEAAELLESLESTLLDLEDSPTDRDMIDTAFRALHTLKGSGAMFGFEAAAKFVHHLENAFDLIRKGTVPPRRELFGAVLGAKDYIRLLIDAPRDADPAEGEALLAAVAGIVAQASADFERESAINPNSAIPSFHIRMKLPQDAMATGTNPLLLLDELRGLGDCIIAVSIDDVPPLDSLAPTICYLSWTLILNTDKPRSAIEDVFLFVLDEMELVIEETAPGLRTAAPEVKSTPKIVAVAPVSAPVPAEAVAAEAPQDPEHHDVPAKQAAGAAASNVGVRVPTERLDGLMDMVGELVIAQARLRQLASSSGNPSLKAVAEEIERLSADLRNTTMDIRMVQIGSLFSRFRRLIRDLSMELGKKIVLVTTGEETELDKTVIDRLADPLVHLIRNSIDHGVETPSQRKAAHKDSEGHIHLSAHHSGAQVLITIRDDGKGLDKTRIRTRAEENGLLLPGAKISDADLYMMIFHPGFSTAEKITSVSGRGVGMDVVKRTIEGLRGTIELDSVSGQGTTITLKLPLTLAIIDGLLIRVGQGRYVIPLGAVEECVELTSEVDRRSAGRSFLNIRGKLVPFLRLRELFADDSPLELYQKVVIVAWDDMHVGLVVDQVIGDHQTVIKSLTRLHADVECFSGATILGDGTVALILDIANLVALGQEREEKMQAS